MKKQKLEGDSLYFDINPPIKPVPEDTSVEIGTGNDPVNNPSHYTAGKVECIDALEAATVNLAGIEAVCTANAIKYLWRWKQKNGKQDLEKAKWYIQKLIDELDEEIIDKL